MLTRFEMTASLAAPPPPPPYSPPRRNIQQQPRPLTMAFDYSPAQIASAPPSRFSTLLGQRPSPEPPVAATRPFPPPPGSSGRGSSRERLLALASLGRRRDPGPSQSPEPAHPVSASRRTGGPSVFHSPEHERVISATAMSPDTFPPRLGGLPPQAPSTRRHLNVHGLLLRQDGSLVCPFLRLRLGHRLRRADRKVYKAWTEIMYPLFLRQLVDHRRPAYHLWGPCLQRQPTG